MYVRYDGAAERCGRFGIVFALVHKIFHEANVSILVGYAIVVSVIPSFPTPPETLSNAKVIVSAIHAEPRVARIARAKSYSDFSSSCRLGIPRGC